MYTHSDVARWKAGLPSKHTRRQHTTAWRVVLAALLGLVVSVFITGLVLWLYR